MQTVHFTRFNVMSRIWPARVFPPARIEQRDLEEEEVRKHPGRGARFRVLSKTKVWLNRCLEDMMVNYYKIVVMIR